MTAAPPDAGSLFVYGSLTCPEVVDAVLGRQPDTELAQAVGWRAVCLRERAFPGLLPDPSSVSDGLTLRGLSEGERRILPAFEGPPL